MVTRKRTRQTLEDGASVNGVNGTGPEEKKVKGNNKALENGAGAEETPSTLSRIRNMWEFANLMQFIYIFGKALKIDESLDAEEFEAECLKPGHSERLSEVGLALLKFASSHRGITPEIFDEQVRKQYQIRRPEYNPFGDEEEPKKFVDLEILTKIRVLYHLSLWTMAHSERLRERMPEQKEADQLYWRIEPMGWDAEERAYFVLDDNRLYRIAEPVPKPPPAPKPKKNSKRGKALARAERKRKSLQAAEAKEENEDGDDEDTDDPNKEPDEFGDRKWECVAITLEEYTGFLASIQKSRDANVRALHRSLTDDVLPVIERAEDNRQRKIAKQQKELLNLEKLATAKRSSRIAGRAEKQKEEEEAALAEQKRRTDMVAAKKEQEKMLRREKDRESRIVTREQRVREREMRRVLQEEELANLSEDSKKLQNGEGRLSERHLQLEMEKRKRALEELEKENDWMFDCSGCGVYGENLDDGTGIISCEKCNVWQHLACLGLTQEAAEDKDFHFVCGMCKKREEDKQKSVKNPIKLDLRKLGSSVSPQADRHFNPQDEASRPKKRKASHDEGQPGSPSPKKPRFQSEGDPMEVTSPASRQISPLQPLMGLFQPGSHSPPINNTAHRPTNINGYANHHHQPAGADSAASTNRVILSHKTSDQPRAENPAPMGHGPYFNSFDRQPAPRPLQATQAVKGAESDLARTSRSPPVEATATKKFDFTPAPPPPRLGFPGSGASPNSTLAPTGYSNTPTQSTPFKQMSTNTPVRQQMQPHPSPSSALLSSPPLQSIPPPSASSPSMQNLPNSQSGLSPTKPSPPFRQPMLPHTSPASAHRRTSSQGTKNASAKAIQNAHPVLPPAPALSPSAQHVDLTPPRKHMPESHVSSE